MNVSQRMAGSLIGRQISIVWQPAGCASNSATCSRCQDAGYKGGKGRTTARGTHVPFIASWPVVIKQGRVNRDLISSVDFLPTLCQAAGTKPPSDSDGVSFLPQLRGEKGDPREWLYMWYWPRPADSLSESAFDHGHKLYRDGRFFDLGADPFEDKPLKADNLAGANAEAAKKLQAVLDPVPRRPPGGTLPAEEEEQAASWKQTMKYSLIFLAILGVATTTPTVAQNADSHPIRDVFLLPYFLGNGETGIYLAYSRDGLKFEWLNQGRVLLPAPAWGEESLTRDPSILYHDGIFHMIWTTSWNSRSIGYAQSRDLHKWSQPKKIDIWGDFKEVRNTWAPELHWDPAHEEFFILWSSTTTQEFGDGDGSGDPHGYDHRTYASRTRDFETFSKPELFFSPQDPEYSVIDPCIAHDDRGTERPDDDRWVMVIKNELGAVT